MDLCADRTGRPLQVAPPGGGRRGQRTATSLASWHETTSPVTSGTLPAVRRAAKRRLMPRAPGGRTDSPAPAPDGLADGLADRLADGLADGLAAARTSGWDAHRSRNEKDWRARRSGEAYRTKIWSRWTRGRTSSTHGRKPARRRAWGRRDHGQPTAYTQPYTGPFTLVLCCLEKHQA